MSFNVVMNGPEATAGSMLNRSIKSGMSVPDNVATMTVVKIAKPTSKPKNKFPFQMYIIGTTMSALALPVSTPVSNSRQINFDRFPL